MTYEELRKVFTDEEIENRNKRILYETILGQLKAIKRIEEHKQWEKDVEFFKQFPIGLLTCYTAIRYGRGEEWRRWIRRFCSRMNMEEANQIKELLKPYNDDFTLNEFYRTYYEVTGRKL